MILIRGGTVLRGSRHAVYGLSRADVLIEGSKVVEVGAIDPPAGAELIDGEGLVLGPGFVDLHVHFRDPGQTWKEDLGSGSRAAAAGGYTGVVVMPNTDPALDNPRLAADVQRRGADIGLVELMVAGAVTKGRAGEQLTDIEALHATGVRLFTDDGDTVSEIGLVRKAMAIIAALPEGVYAEHAEDRAIAGAGQMHAGPLAEELGIVGLPAEAEEIIVERDLQLAEETGAHLHVQHVSTAGSVRLIRHALNRGVSVTAEVTPHHLALTSEAVTTERTDLKMYPPLREEQDRLALVAALEEGVIGSVATDHAPHGEGEKDVAFEEAARGVIGLETAFPIILQALNGDVGRLFERMSIGPARIARMPGQGRPVEPGSPANLVLIDPKASWTVGAAGRSKSANSPFIGREMTGKVLKTWYRGRMTFNGEGNDV